MDEEAVNGMTDRRTFLSGLLGLNFGSLLPRQSWFGINERTYARSVQPDVYPSGETNQYSAIAVGEITTSREVARHFWR